jgi:acetylornithine/succinyldiaminopimelate/putrescine aminotransferase
MSSVQPDFVKYSMFKMRGRGLGRGKRGVYQSEVRISNAIFEENSSHEVMIQTSIPSRIRLAPSLIGQACCQKIHRTITEYNATEGP